MKLNHAQIHLYSTMSSRSLNAIVKAPPIPTLKNGRACSKYSSLYTLKTQTVPGPPQDIWKGDRRRGRCFSQVWATQATFWKRDIVCVGLWKPNGTRGRDIRMQPVTSCECRHDTKTCFSNMYFFFLFAADRLFVLRETLQFVALSWEFLRMQRWMGRGKKSRELSHPSVVRGALIWMVARCSLYTMKYEICD